jgi:hypothetical protein
VAGKVDTDPVGISGLLSDIHPRLPVNILDTAARYIRVVVTKYSDSSPAPGPWFSVPILPLLTPDSVPVTNWLDVEITSAESMMNDAPEPMVPADEDSVIDVVEVNADIVYQNQSSYLPYLL